MKDLYQFYSKTIPLKYVLFAERDSPARRAGRTLRVIFIGLVFSASLLLAACDATAPGAPLPDPVVANPPSSNTGKTGEPGAGSRQWAFPPEIEKSRVVFTTFDMQDLRWNVHKINVDSTGLQAFDFPRDNPGDFPDTEFHAFRWSPDGRRLVYRGSNTGTDNWYLVLIDSSGTERRLLTDIGGFTDDPSWSPNGDRILYGRGGFLGGFLGILFQTSIVDTLGNSIDFFIDPQSRFFDGDSVFYALFDDGQNALYDAEWAPDGEHLYLTGVIGKRRNDATVTASDVEIFKAEIATGRVVERLTRNGVDETGFIVSPDGRRLLIPRGEGSDFRIFLMNLPGDVALPLTTEPHENPPRWAADSRHILYEKRTAVYLLDVENPDRERLITPGFHTDIFMEPEIDTGIERR